jgi:Ni,Fe-hydrogenase I small subunit
VPSSSRHRVAVTNGETALQVAGKAPMIPLDENLRPTWLFGKTVHEGCDRAGYYEQADWAPDYNSPKCQVKIGCWGPVVNCNVPKRHMYLGNGRVLEERHAPMFGFGGHTP